MPKGIRLKPEQIVAKLCEIDVKIGQSKDVLKPSKQPPRSRLWLEDGSCVRLRPELNNVAQITITYQPLCTQAAICVLY